MIASLRGTIQSHDPDGIVLEVSGVGYRLNMSSRSLALTGAVSGEMLLYTHLHVREDVLSLFGFVEREEREFFLILKGVSGIGPKVALAILSAYAPGDLRRAVLNRDVALFQSISGIGKKTAERLVLELKDKVGELPTAAIDQDQTEAASGYYLAREGLITLGYSFAEAEAALAGCDPAADAEELIREALKSMGTRAQEVKTDGR
jgi:Holliday junction DNA helicase RuvA